MTLKTDSLIWSHRLYDERATDRFTHKTTNSTQHQSGRGTFRNISSHLRDDKHIDDGSTYHHRILCRPIWKMKGTWYKKNSYVSFSANFRESTSITQTQHNNLLMEIEKLFQSIRQSEFNARGRWLSWGVSSHSSDIKFFSSSSLLFFTSARSLVTP